MLKGNLYTTYLGKAKKIPKDAIQIIIMREPPFDVNKYPQYLWFPELSPSQEILHDYKKGIINWESFEHLYRLWIGLVEVDSSLRIENILNALNCGKDVYLICCEKDPVHCHRTILGNILKEEYTIDFKEIEG